MKKIIAVFSLLAVVFALTSKSYSQIEFTNKSQCFVQVTVTYYDDQCDPQCVSIPQFVPPETEVNLTFPPCAIFTTPQAVGFFSVDVFTGFTTVTVGNGCGFSSIANFIDCTGTLKTLQMYAPNAVAIY